MKKIFKGIVYDLSIKKQADDLGVNIWQTPSFLFLLMGIITIVVMLAIYFISRNYESPELLALSECGVVAVIFIIGTFIIRNVEHIAKLNKMKTEFVSIASHQLKTPLSQMNWEVELLLSKHKEGLKKDQLEIIKTISDSHLKMTRLVNDLLDVARIDQGRLALFREKFNLLRLVREAIENNQQLAKSHNVEIEIKTPDSLPEIMGDKRRIGVVADNILSNAVKYTENKGSVEISIKQKENFIIICIKDNGVGIPKYQQDQIFQKFFRSDNASRYKESGTGLGLYIAKNVIEQSGGDIWFESKENIGSTFCFSMPLDFQEGKKIRRYYF